MTGATARVFALLGDPVAHSLSPLVHNAAFRALGLDAVYVALRCTGDDVEHLMRAIGAAGGGGNLTVPHKQVGAAQAATPSGATLPAVNTFWSLDGRLVVDDTDHLGITEAWRRLGAPAGDWLLLGTGGSAHAAARAAGIVGAGVAVRSRSGQRAASFLSGLAAMGGRVAVDTDIRFVVNCTPLGLADSDPVPLPDAELPRGAAVLDLVYRPGATRWVRGLVAAGWHAADGREALLGQAVAAFARWFPGVDVPTEVMRAALRTALGPAVG